MPFLESVCLNSGLNSLLFVLEVLSSDAFKTGPDSKTAFQFSVSSISIEEPFEAE